jgi:flagellar assembly protein FliH
MAAEFSFAELAPAPASSFARPSAPSAPSAHSVLEAAAHAEAEAESARAAAREEGYADGLAAGRAEALAALGPAAAALEEALAGSRQDAAANTERLEAQAVDLALYIAEKVVGGAVAVEPARVLEAVRGALRSLVERERVTVLVHPDDLELVTESIGEIRASLGGIEHCDVQAERRVGRGGAVVRTPEGDVDARLETKLVWAREVVEAALGAA